jgi:hypothetical protein
MGFMDKLGSILGRKKTIAEDTVRGPGVVLRDHGIDPSNLKFSFNNDGSVDVSGNVQDQSECDRICELIKDIPNVSGVNNNMVVSAPEPAAEPEPEVVVAEAEPTESAPESELQGKTYTVQAGDTLWAIAAKAYGSGAEYMKIFEANTSILEHPDKIDLGQELVIPKMEES